MRFDLYTSEDRASEAMYYYRQEQMGRYMLWCIIGALVTAITVTVILSWLLPSQMNVLEIKEKLRYADTSEAIFLFVTCCVLTGRPLAIILVLTGVLFIAGIISAKPIALYQGVIFGILAGAIVFAVIWILLSLFGVSPGIKTWVPRISGMLSALIFFAMGLLGGFLPDVE